MRKSCENHIQNCANKTHSRKIRSPETKNKRQKRGTRKPESPATLGIKYKGILSSQPSSVLKYGVRWLYHCSFYRWCYNYLLIYQWLSITCHLLLSMEPCRKQLKQILLMYKTKTLQATAKTAKSDIESNNTTTGNRWNSQKWYIYIYIKQHNHNR